MESNDLPNDVSLCCLHVVAKPAISYLKRFLVPFLKIAAKSQDSDYLELRHSTVEIGIFVLSLRRCTSCGF
jgi:hypothetical protein